MSELQGSRDPELEREIASAKAGDRDALERVIRAVQADVLRLAHRFLWHPEDAEDACQEILIRVVTGLGGFRGESRFRTWVYRIACNALLTTRRRRMETFVSFEEFGEDLARGLSDERPAVEDEVEASLLLEEVKIGCTLAMLQCLDRDPRRRRRAGSSRGGRGAGDHAGGLSQAPVARPREHPVVHAFALRAHQRVESVPVPAPRDDRDRARTRGSRSPAVRFVARACAAVSRGAG